MLYGIHMFSRDTNDRLSSLTPEVLDLGAPVVDGKVQIDLRRKDWTDDMKERLLVIIEPSLIIIRRKDKEPLQFEHVIYGTGFDRQIIDRKLVLRSR
jgi:hypothetical protein